MNTAKKLLAAAVMAASVPAFAESPDWSYVEASYLSSEIDGLGDELEPEGFEIKGSWLVSEHLFVDGAYSSQEDDINTILGDIDLELDVYNLGVGARFPVAASTDLYGRVSYENWKLELDSFDEDENGYGIAAGVRSVVLEGLELNAEVGYLDVGDAVDGEERWKVGGIYSFDNGIGIGLSYGEIDDLETLSATLRYAFR